MLWIRQGLTACVAATVILLATHARAEEAVTTGTEADSAITTEPQEPDLVPCGEFPRAPLTDEDLARLVPDNSPGRVYIRWRTETQEDNYGFNIYRAKSPDGPYEKVNRSIIPGEGTTNIPKDYCFIDQGLPRGEKFYYYIESVSNQGVAEVVEGTKGTEVKVKTVAEEREWLRRKAAGGDTPTTTPVLKAPEQGAKVTTPTAAAGRPPARQTAAPGVPAGPPVNSDPIY
ncbi:MAG: hypothetical protein N2111_05235 [Candidatus Sumerlaeaceae bacterium]|nr:hypothetical protein [Candidatus Sumerlaeaceae bacterium]